jgi:histidyl-tRNA synthetase
MYSEDPVRKFYLIGPMFRRERPQKGRYRQFYQLDVEAFGIAAPYIDVQMIHILHLLFQRLGVTDTHACVNSLGCPKCRPDYRQALTAMLVSVQNKLCVDCQRRKARNPLRVLDCKVPQCREAVADAPALIEYLCDDCREHFETVTSNLTRLKVPYEVDRRLVRGLDYYTRTAFEMQTKHLGAQSAIAGGGRYDGLVETLGGPPIPAIGFAIGFDRLAEIVSSIKAPEELRPDLFIAALGPEAQKKAFHWMADLCERGIRTDMDYSDRSLKSQLKRADRLGADRVLMVGEQELKNGTATLRDMGTSEQREVQLDNLADQL